MPDEYDVARNASLAWGGHEKFTIMLLELFFDDLQIRGSIVVSISACHAEDPGSIPGRGVFISLYFSI